MQTIAVKAIETSRRFTLLAAMAAMAIVMSTSLRAATILDYKGNNTTNLNVAGSWINGVVPTAGYTIVVNDTVGGNNTFFTGTNATISVDGFQFWAGNASSVSQTFSATNNQTFGGRITVGSGGINMSNTTQNVTFGNITLNLGSANNTQSWNVASGYTLTASANIRGSSQALTIDGNGRVVLGSAATSLTANGNGNNTVFMTTSVANLFVGEVVGSGGTLLNTGTPFTISYINFTNNSVVLNQAPTGAPASATMTFSANDDFNGGITLNSGTLALAGSNGLGAGILTINGGFLDATAASTASNSVNINSSFTFNGTAALSLTGIGVVTLGTSPVITVNASTLTIASIIKDNGNNYGLTKGGNGTLSLTGVNTYTGNTVINTGTLLINTFSTAGLNNNIGLSTSAATSLVINDGGILSYNSTANGSSDHLFSVGIGNATLNAGTSAGATGVFDFSNTGNIGFSATGGNSNLILQGSGIGGGSLEVGLTDNPGGGVLSVTKNGTNTWLLNESAANNTFNTYTGGTTVNSGVLIIAPGAFTPTGNVLVNSGGMVASTGALDNTFLAHISTLSAGSVGITSSTTNSNTLDFGAFNGLGIGAASGLLTYTGTLTSSSGVVPLGGGSGQLQINNATDLTGNINVQIVGASGQTGNVSFGAQQVYTGTTNISGGTLNLSGNNVLPNGGNVIISGGTLSYGSNNNTLDPLNTLTLSSGTLTGGFNANQGSITANSIILQSGTVSGNVNFGGTDTFYKTTSGNLSFASGNFTGTGFILGGTLGLTNSISPAARFALSNGVTVLSEGNNVQAAVYFYNLGGTTTFSSNTASYNSIVVGDGTYFLLNGGGVNTVNLNMFSAFGGTVNFGSTTQNWRGSSSSTGSNLNFAFTNFDFGTGAESFSARNTTSNYIFGGVQNGALNGPGFNAESNGNGSINYVIGSLSLNDVFNGKIGATTGSNSAGMTKVGTSTLSMISNSQNTGPIVAAGGTLKLDFSNANAASTDLVGGNTSVRAPLTFNGGELLVFANPSGAVATNQNFGAVTVSAGGGQLLANSNGGLGTTVTLGSLTATATGGSLNFAQIGSNLTFTTTSNRTVGANNTDNTYGGRITFTDNTGATNWATSLPYGVAGNYILSGFSGYTGFVGSGGNNSINYLATDNQTVTAAETVNSLKVTTTQNGQIADLGSNKLTLQNGGLLFTGANAYTIGNGTLVSALTGNSDLILQNYGTGGLTVNAIIANNIGNSTLTVAGPGTTNLAGLNTYIGQTYLNGSNVVVSTDQNFGGGSGTVVVAASGSNASSPTVNLASATLPVGFGPGSTFMGRTVLAISGTTVTLNGNALIVVGAANTVIPFGTASTLNVNGATITPNGSFSLIESNTTGSNTTTANRNIIIYGGGGTFNVGSGNTLTVAGTISSQANNYGPLTKTGNGKLVLSGNNTYGGQTVISGGTLSVNRLFNGVPVAGVVVGANVTGSFTGFTLPFTDEIGVGMTVTGANITAGTTIVGIDPVNRTFTLSQAISNGSFTPTINGATLTVLPNDNLGQTTIAPTALVLDGGSLQYTGGNTSTNRGFSLTQNGGTLDASGTGTLNVTGFIPINTIGSGNRTLTLAGSNTGNNTISDPIVDGTGGSTSIDKTGIGQWSLLAASNTNTFTGNVSVSGGTLGLIDSSTNNIANAPNIAVAAGATLDTSRLSGGGITLIGGATPQTLTGAGSVKGVVTTAANSVIAPGTNGVGTLTLAGLTANAGSIYTFEFASNSSYDQLFVTNSGGLTINGGGLNLLSVGSTTQKWLPNGPGGTVTNQVYDLFNYTGTLTGSVSNLSILNPQAGFTYLFGTDGLGNVTLTINGTPPIANWLATGSGSWSTGGNWDAAVPTNSGDTANFNGTNTGAVSVTLDGDHSVGALTFTSSHSYSINQGSSGKLTFDNQGAASTVGVFLGNHSITAPVVLNDNVQVTVSNPADSLTIAGNISSNGTKGVQKLGSGLLALNGTNTYTGNTTLGAGTLQVGSSSALSTGTVAITGTAELEAGANGLTIANNMTIAGGFAGTIDAQSNTITLSGVIGNSSGAGALKIDGTTGIVVLTNNETYTGNTSIVGGTLQIGAGGVSGSVIGSISNNGTLAINKSGNVTFNNLISGTGGLNQIGTSTTNLTQANTFSGNVNISGGNVLLSNSNALQNAVLNYNNQGGNLVVGSNVTAITLGGLVGAQDFALRNASGNQIVLTVNIPAIATTYTYNGNLSGTGDLTKTGTGTENIANANLTGNVVINGGTLEFSGGTANLTALNINTFTGAEFYLNGANLNLTGSTVIRESNGYLQDSGNSTFGTIVTNSNGGDTGTIRINGGNFTANFLGISRSIGNSTGGAILSLNTNFTGLQVWGGTVTIGSMQIGSNVNGANGNSDGGMRQEGGVVNVAGTVDVGYISGSTRWNVLNVDGGVFNSTDTISGVVLNAQAGNSNVGELLLTGGVANINKITFGNLTAGAVSGGTGLAVLQPGATLYLGSGGAVTTSSAMGSTISFSGGLIGASADWSTAVAIGTANSTTIQAADANGVAKNITISSVVNGGGSLVKTGAGTLTLSGSSGYTGGTTINGGTIAVTSNNSLGNRAGALTINNGTLEIAATSTTLVSSRNITVGTANATVQVDAGKTYINSGYWTGGGNLTKTGNGLLYLTGNNSYTGATTINSGTLSVSSITDGGAAVNGFGGSPVVTVGPFSQNNSDDRLTNNNVFVTVDSISGLFVGQTVTASAGITNNATVHTTIANITSTFNPTTSITTYTIGLSTNATASNAAANLTFGGDPNLYNIDTSTLTIGQVIIGGNVNAASTIVAIDNINNIVTLNQPSFGSGNTSLVSVTANGLGAADNSANSLVINGGALDYNALSGNDSTTQRSFTVGPKGATVSVSGGGNVNFQSGATLAIPFGTNLTLDGSNTGYGALGAGIPDGNDTVATTVNKNGTGSWFLTGSSSYTGATNVNAGTLNILGALGNTPVTVKGGASLGGTGSIGGPVTAQTNGIINPGGSQFVGTLTLNNLTLSNSAVLNYEIHDINTYDQILATNLNIGSAKVNLYAIDDNNVTGILTTPSVYNLISFNGTYTGDPTNLSVGNVNPILTYAFSQGSGNLTVTVAFATDILAWTGNTSSSGLWSNANNWANATIGDGATKRVAFGNNSFTDLSGTVTLDSNRTVGGLFFNTNYKSFTINSTGGSVLSLDNGGNASLVEVLAGTHTVSADVNIVGSNLSVVVQPSSSLSLTGNISQSSTANVSFDGGGAILLSGNNSFSGITDIDNTTLTVTSLANGGVNSAIGASSSASSSLLLDGTNLVYVGSGANTDRLFTIEATTGNATITNNGTGALNFTNTGALAYEGSNTINNLLLGGSYTGASTFAPVIADNGSGTTSLTKNGQGKWTLGDNNTYSGITTINGGTLSASNLNNVQITGNYTSWLGATISANFAIDNNTVNVPSVAGLTTGQIVSGAGIAPNTSIISINATGGTITLNQSSVGDGSAGEVITVAPSRKLTDVSNIANLGLGETITGNNFAGNTTTIVGIDIASGTVTVSANVTGNGTDTLNSLAPVATSLGNVSVVGTGSLIIDGTLEYTGSTYAVNDRGFTVSGDGNVTLLATGSGGINFNSSAGWLYLNSGNDIVTLDGVSTARNRLNAVLSNGNGIGSLVKQGTGLWNLTGVNTYTGGTTINGGTLQINNNASLGTATYSNTLTINNGTLQISDASFTLTNNIVLGTANSTILVDAGRTLTLANASLTNISGNGTLNVIGSTTPGNLTVGSVIGGTFIVTNNNTFVGGTNVNNATLAFGADDLSNQGNTTLGTGAINLSGGAVLRFGGSGGGIVYHNIPNNITLDNAAIFVYDGQQWLNGNITINGGGAEFVTSWSTKEIEINGALNGSGNLTIDNTFATGQTAFVRVYSGNNSYNGTIIIDGSNNTSTGNNADFTGQFAGGNLAIHNGTALQYANIIDNSRTANALQFNGTSTVTIASLAGTGNIGLPSAALILGGNNATSEYDGILSGAGSLVKNGTGTFILGNVNTYTGTTTINGGTISVGNGSTSGRLGTGVVNDNGNLLFNLSGNVTSAGAIRGNGTLTVQGLGSGQVTLTANNSFTGGVLINSGTLSINSIADGGQTLITGSTIGSAPAIANATTSNGSTSVTVSSNSGLSVGQVVSGTGIAANSTITAISGNVLTLSLPATATENGNTTLSFAGLNIVTVSNTTVLTANQAITGTNIPLGAIIGSIGNGTITMTSNASTTGTANLTTFTPNALGGSSNAASNLVIDNGTLKYTGAAANSDRLFTIGASGSAELAASGSGALNLTNTGAIAIDANSTSSQILNLGGTNKGLNTLAASINDNGAAPTAVNKLDAGTWVLTNNNTYSGGTNIYNGVLYANNLVGSATGTGAVSVSSGANATLAGNGFVAGAVTVSSGGRVTPGTSTLGTLTLASLSLASGSIINFNFASNGSANSQLTVSNSGGFAFADGTIINLYNQNTTSHFNQLGNYTLINFNGDTSGQGDLGTLAANIGTASLGYTYTFTENTTSLFLQVALSQGIDNWIATGNGNWGNGANWFGSTVGGGAGAPAIFASSNTGPAVVTLNGTQVVGSLVINSPNTYSFNATTGSNLTLDNLSGVASITQDGDVTDTISAPVVLSANAVTAGTSIAVSQINTLVISGNISEQAAGGALTLNGLGNVTLSGNNTYTGGTILSSGTLNINAAHAIGTGNLVLADGVSLDNTSGAPVTLSTVNAQEWQGNVSFLGSNDLNLGAGNVTVDQTSIVTVNQGNLTVGGKISGNTGTTSNIFLTGNGTLTVLGNISGSTTTVTVSGSTLVLSGSNNTFSNGLRIDAGTVTTTANGAIPNGTLTIVNAGNLNIGSTNDTIGAFILANGTVTGTGTLSSSSNYVMQSGNISVNLAGTGALTKDTSGNVTMTGNNSYANRTTVSAGTLYLNGNNSFASGNSSANGLVYGTVISGGNLVLGSSNILNDLGSVTISSGALTMGSYNDTVATLGFGGGNITGTGTITTTGNISFTGGTGTINPNLSGTGSLVQSGGNVTVLGNLSYTGNTFLSGGTQNLYSTTTNTAGYTQTGGTLNLYNAAGLTPTTVTLSGGTFMNLTGSAYAFSQNPTFGGDFTLAGGDITFNGVISLLNANRIVSGNNNTVTFNQALLGGNAYGFTFGGSNSTLVINSQLFLDSNVASGRFNISGSNTTVVLNSGASINASYTGGVNGWNSLGVNAGDNVTLTLNGNSTFYSNRELGVADNGGANGSATGTVNINDSAVLVLSDLWLGKGSSNVSVNGNGIVNQNGGTVNLTMNTTTINSSNTANTGGLVMGGHTANSTNNATYNLNGGTLITYVIHGHDLGNGTATFNFNGGTLQPLSDTTVLMTNSLTAANVQAGGAIINTSGYNATIAQNITTDPALGNTTDGGLTKNGNGTLTLTGVNSYTGNTVINGGTLQVGDGNATGSVGAAGIIVNAALAVNRSDTVTLANAVSGNGTLNQVGAGTTIVTGTNTYTGGTNIAAGTLQVGNNGTVGTLGSGDVNNNGTLAYYRSDDISVTAAISGAGALSHLSNANVTLLGANTYTGGTNIAAGSLIVGNGTTAGQLGTGGINDNGTLVYNHSDDVSVDDIISGTGGLTKLGTGNLTVTGTNTYTGNTVVTSGIVAVTGSGSLGAGESTVVMTGGKIQAGGAGAILNNVFTGTGGTIQATGGDLEIGSFATTGVNFGGTIDTGTHAVTIDSQPSGGASGLSTVNSVTMGEGGSLTSVYGVNLQVFGSITATGNATVYGPFNNPSVFTGNYTNNDPDNGDPIYNVATIVGPSGAAKLSFAGPVTGGGDIQGNVRILNGYNPGTNLDALINQTNGTLSFGSGATFTLNLYSTAGRGVGYDAYNIGTNGVINFTNAIFTLVAQNGYSPAAGKSFTFFKVSAGTNGSFVGTFASIDTSAAPLASGLTWDFSTLYTTGIASVIIAVPEPSELAALAGALALGVAVVVRRRRARAVATNKTV